MQQWEYLFVTYARPAVILNLSGKVPVLVNGEQVGKMIFVDFCQYCNELGAEGWEVVAGNNAPDPGALFLVFKRPTVKPEKGQQ